MKIAYLVLAHANPGHFSRLAKALEMPSWTTFVHLDQKTDLETFLKQAEPLASNIVWSQRRFLVRWGEFSMVLATLQLLEQALADPREFDRFVLLSGACYPLLPATEIDRFFHEAFDVEFMNLIPMPAEHAGKPLSRLTHFWVQPHAPWPGRVFRRLLNMFGIGPRLRAREFQAKLGHLIPYAGDQWWALTRAAARHIQTFVQKQPTVVNFFRNTHCSDEMFFQIVLGNSEFKQRIQRNLTYADWENSEDGSHPAWLEEKQIRNLMDKECEFQAEDLYGPGSILFARKFPNESRSLIDSIEAQRRDGR